MAIQGQQLLYSGAAFIVGTYVLFLCLVEGKPFLAPLAIAVVLALLLLPVANKFESWGMGRGASSLLNTLLLFLVSMGFAGLIGLQIQGFIADWDKAQQKLMPQVERLEQYLYDQTPLKKEHLEKEKAAGNMGKHVMGFLQGLYRFSGDYLLTVIYVFFLLNYRKKFRKFFLKLFPGVQKDKVRCVLYEIAAVTQGYLYGKFLLMIFIAALYMLGMGIAGVSNFIIISLLAAMLTIIPYIGNIIGFVIAIGLGYVADGDTSALIGIVATFAIVQFVETYFFEPYVVGDHVHLDPLIIILAVVAGSLLWGVIGMILSVPVLGMANVAFKYVGPLKPWHYLLGTTEKKK